MIVEPTLRCISSGIKAARFADAQAPRTDSDGAPTVPTASLYSAIEESLCAAFCAACEQFEVAS